MRVMPLPVFLVLQQFTGLLWVMTPILNVLQKARTQPTCSIIAHGSLVKAKQMESVYYLCNFEVINFLWVVELTSVATSDITWPKCWIIPSLCLSPALSVFLSPASQCQVRLFSKAAQGPSELTGPVHCTQQWPQFLGQSLSFIQDKLLRLNVPGCILEQNENNKRSKRRKCSS